MSYLLIGGSPPSTSWAIGGAPAFGGIPGG